MMMMTIKTVCLVALVGTWAAWALSDESLQHQLFGADRGRGLRSGEYFTLAPIWSISEPPQRQFNLIRANAPDQSSANVGVVASLQYSPKLLASNVERELSSRINIENGVLLRGWTLPNDQFKVTEAWLLIGPSDMEVHTYWEAKCRMVQDKQKCFARPLNTGSLAAVIEIRGVDFNVLDIDASGIYLGRHNIFAERGIIAYGEVDFQGDSIPIIRAHQFYVPLVEMSE